MRHRSSRPGQGAGPSCFGDDMPRMPRAHVAGGIFHVTSRGNRRAPVFADELDRFCFLGMLERTIARFDWKCLAYCLMTNHFHLVVGMREPLLSRGMHWLNGCYAQRFNGRHGFKGHLFEDRFYSEPVESHAHLLELTRYLPLNPVRARLCLHPAEWRWSSYGATVGRRPAGFVATDAVLDLFGRTRDLARVRYEAFVADGTARALEVHA